MSRDPAEYVDGMNDYMMERGNPLRYLDSNGHQAFVLSRPLMPVAKVIDWPLPFFIFVSHTFVYTADKMRGIWCLQRTYGWGEAEGVTKKIVHGKVVETDGWTKNTRVDINAASDDVKAFIRMGKREGKNTKEFDGDVDKAYEKLLQQPEEKHDNGIILSNCKTEAQHLIDVAMNPSAPPGPAPAPPENLFPEPLPPLPPRQLPPGDYPPYQPGQGPIGAPPINRT